MRRSTLLLAPPKLRNPVEERRIPGFARPVSAVGVSVGPWVLAPGVGDPARSLQRWFSSARGRGVTLFDLRAGGETARVERAFAPVLRSAEGAVTLLSELAPAEGGTGPSEVDRLFRESGERLGGHAPDLLTLPERRLQDPGWVEAFGELERIGGLGAWGIRRAPSAGGGAVPGVDPPASSARFVDLAFNLLNPHPASEVITTWREAGRAVLVHDVHAGGRLNGERLARHPVERPTRPPTVSELRREYAPVLDLAGATGSAPRPLAERALRFVLSTPG
ncbi:MAG: hypothetical protein ACREC5_04015, partial [Thermoplasmata archaeon]